MMVIEKYKDYKGENLIFIIGSPRSGTTWLQRLLAEHPMIKTGQESDIFDMFICPQLKAWKSLMETDNTKHRLVGLPCYLKESEFKNYLHQYMLLLLTPIIKNIKDGDLFIEKTPSNALFIPEILDILPKSRFIHILRHPKAVVESMIACSKSWGSDWAPRNSISALRMWQHHVLAVQKSKSMLTRQNFIEIKYEDLLNEPEVIIQYIIDFIQLNWDIDLIEKALDNTRKHYCKTYSWDVQGEFQKYTIDGKLNDPDGFIKNSNNYSKEKILNIMDKIYIKVKTKKLIKRFGYI